MKVSVSRSGIHLLKVNDLRRMGFSDPAQVKVFGYGGGQLSDVLESSTFIDDLPQVPSLAGEAGVYFYATGPETWTETQGNHWIKRLNPFSQLGYYYITDNGDIEREELSHGTAAGQGVYADSYTEVLHHEIDQMSPGETGYELVGEDFINTSARSFKFDMPGRVDDTDVWMECSFYACSSSESRLVFSVNDSALPYTSSDRIYGTSDHYAHAVEAVSRKTFSLDSPEARVTVTYSNPGVVKLARLNYLTLNYTRKLDLTDGPVEFFLRDAGGKVTGSSVGKLNVWDITDPLKPVSLTVDENCRFSPAGGGLRRYIAWEAGGEMPAPKMVADVPNQNIHSLPVPDMVIFTHPQWRSQAERVAALHREDKLSPLSVLIIEPDELYNEYSSGSPDANALRKLLKMFWDRSSQSGEGRLQFALIMGRSTYDNRRLSASVASLNYPTLPGWQTETSLNDNSSYTTDDIYAALLDGSGGSLRSDYQCIGVGRMPVISLSDAANVVDKLYSYVNTPLNSSWKMRALMVADDENDGVFMEHTEKMIENAMNVAGSDCINWDKVYIDAYNRQNGTYPGARNDMFRLLTEGVMWWNFAGHANPTSWTADGLMTYTDINNLYLKHFPFVFAATCDFLRWDSKDVSAAEILYRTSGSGIIGAVSATRPALIPSNGEYMAHMGKFMFATGSDGLPLPIGEIFRRSKNGGAGKETWNNANKLRYVLMGDPAMRLCVPSCRVVLDAINGLRPDLDAQTTVMAGQEVILEGRILDSAGTLLSDFNGRFEGTLYDAEYSTTSHGYGAGENVTFEQRGKRLQVVVDSVKGGKFATRLIVPGEVAQNFRPASLSMYAVDSEGRDAASINRDFYVYGIDENLTPDDAPPSIDAFYLNHSSFASGDKVNDRPVVIAEISDNRSVNLSSAGIGHQMLLTIDGRSLTDTP
ncbi:MAG: type IX secretion system sortase PorU, partial [Muribaculaceae bacterium]|nr:type IX secretion system sortase PorU [Muribaculaceae bacterium]